MIRPDTIREAAAQAVLHAIKRGDIVDIWIDNDPNTPKYVVQLHDASSNVLPAPPAKDSDFVARVKPKAIMEEEMDTTFEFLQKLVNGEVA